MPNITIDSNDVVHIKPKNIFESILVFYPSISEYSFFDAIYKKEILFRKEKIIKILKHRKKFTLLIKKNELIDLISCKGLPKEVKEEVEIAEFDRFFLIEIKEYIDYLINKSSMIKFFILMFAFYIFFQVLKYFILSANHFNENLYSMCKENCRVDFLRAVYTLSIGFFMFLGTLSPIYFLRKKYAFKFSSFKKLYFQEAIILSVISGVFFFQKITPLLLYQNSELKKIALVLILTLKDFIF